jgi:hypothetical protein
MNELDIFVNYLNTQTWYTRPFLPRIMQDTLNNLTYSRFTILLAAIHCQKKAFISWFPGFATFYHSYFFTSCQFLHERGLLCVDFVHHQHWRQIYEVYSFFYLACRLGENRPLAKQLFHEFLTLSPKQLKDWQELAQRLAQLDLLNLRNVQKIWSYRQQEDIFFLFSLNPDYLKTLIPYHRRNLQDLLENPTIKGLLSHREKATCKLIFDFLFHNFGCHEQETYLAVVEKQNVDSLWQAIQSLKTSNMINEENVTVLIYNSNPCEAAIFITLQTFQLTPSAMSSQTPSPNPLPYRTKGYGSLFEFNTAQSAFVLFAQTQRPRKEGQSLESGHNCINTTLPMA